MSDDEAQTLSNYFAAVDNAPFPYQRIPQQEPRFLAEREADYHGTFDDNTPYLQESWQMLNNALCLGCHSVGGREYKATDPLKSVHAPNLDRVAQRFRPDYLNLWLMKPKAFISYTSMPTNFPRNTKQLPQLFEGDAFWQSRALADALLNYYNLMETYGKTAEVASDAPPPTEPAENPPENAEAAAAEAAPAQASDAGS
jgi:hypothetical protein